MFRTPRIRSAVVAGFLLATAVPMVATATAPHLSCAPKPVGSWETIRVAAFGPISGIAASDHDVVEAYSVGRTAPQDVLATNGYTVKVSHTHGCAWSTGVELNPTVSGSQSFVGVQSRIVSVAVSAGVAMAAVQEGTGSASRPHILVSGNKGAAGSWASSDNGLPAQGAPRLLKAAGDGRTFYLTVSPTATGGSGGGSTGIIPGLPGGGPTDTPTGFLYRTIDGGANWTLQTGATDLPSGGTGFSQLEIDSGNNNTLYGIVSGRLLLSHDGGGSFTAVAGSGYTAVAAGGPSQVYAFSAAGGVQSQNGGGTFTTFGAPSGISGAATRSGNSGVLVEVGGSFSLLEPGTDRRLPIPPPRSARTGTLLGDRSTESSFHALAGHSLLRYVDPPSKTTIITRPPIGDLTIPPPIPGVVSPSARNVTLPVGQSSVESFTLDLPKNPTPLDLFFLVDVSASMKSFIDNLKTNLRGIVRGLTADRIPLKVGVGTVGTGPADNQPPHPPTYVDPLDPTRPYVKPELYHLLRAVGDTGPDLDRTIAQLQIESKSPAPGTYEGQLLALKNLANGAGTRTYIEETNHLPTITGIAPGQAAGFRQTPGVRKIVILGTDERFEAPFGGTPDEQDLFPDSTKEDPHLNFAKTLQILRAADIKVIGFTAGATESTPDLRTVAQGTGAVAPPQGVDCGDQQHLDGGDPLVCTNGDDFSTVIERVLASLVDRQPVKVVPHTHTPVLGVIDAHSLASLDVKQPNRVGFSVGVSCLDVKPGVYHQDVDVTLRDYVVGRARINVDCLKANTLARPRPIVPPDPPVNPPPAAAPNPPPPPAPAPPAVQPQAQPQVQTQVQIQPLTAGAIQEQQELQLALALNGTLKDDDPVFNAGQQMAMVDRRKREEVQALGVLAFAVVACAGLGLAGLRARPEITVRRAR